MTSFKARDGKYLILFLENDLENNYDKNHYILQEMSRKKNDKIHIIFIINIITNTDKFGVEIGSLKVSFWYLGGTETMCITFEIIYLTI